MSVPGLGCRKRSARFAISCSRKSETMSFFPRSFAELAAFADKGFCQPVGTVHKIPSELSFDAGGDAIRWSIQGLNLQNVAIFRPNVKAASYTAIRADCFRPADAQLPHVGFGFRELQNRSIARLRLDALNHIDHAAQRCLWERREKSRMAEHGFFHKRVTRAHRDAVAAGDTARFADC